MDFVTYDVMPPVAARHIFEAIHWTPAIRWHVEQIDVLHPIRLQWNTVPKPMLSGEVEVPHGGLYRALVLLDVAYVVRARLEMTAEAGARDTMAQHMQMFLRRAKAKRYFREPFLGLRECPADVKLMEKSARLPKGKMKADAAPVDLGWMLYDTHENGVRRPSYFRPILADGAIEIPAPKAAILAR